VQCGEIVHVFAKSWGRLSRSQAGLTAGWTRCKRGPQLAKLPHLKKLEGHFPRLLSAAARSSATRAPAASPLSRRVIPRAYCA
jgi:hypothetical protein